MCVHVVFSTDIAVKIRAPFAASVIVTPKPHVTFRNVKYKMVNDWWGE